LKKQYVMLGILMFSIFPFALSNTIVSKQNYTTIYQSASTLVGGYITTNTTWTLAGSPYIVVADVIVVPNVFLAIEPGVVVKFAAGKNLVIDGGLIAQGNSAHKITFTSNVTAPIRGNWGSIRIREGGQISNVSYWVVEYAQRGLYPEGTRTLFIQNTLLRFNKQGIFVPELLSAYISNSTIVDNDAGIYLNQGLVWIDNSIISRNGVYGVEGTGGIVQLFIVYNAVTMQNSTVSYNFNTGVDCPNTLRNSNFIENNGTAGGSDAQLISHCNIVNNSGGFTRPRVVEYSNFSGNNWPGNPYRISDSLVSNNYQGLDLMPNGVAERVNVSYNTLYGIRPMENAIIRQSVIAHNQGPGITPNYGGDEPFEVHYTNIYNNSYYDLTLQNIFIPGEKVQADVNATYNWWGTTNETLIREHIYDYYDNYTMGRVFSTPYLTAPCGRSLTPTGHNVTVSPTSDVSLTFENVTSQGQTTVAKTASGPAPPSGFELAGQYYDIQTTATYSGGITIRIVYDDSGMTPVVEANLRLRQWNATSLQWVDITTRVDTQNNVIYGETSHLSCFGITGIIPLSPEIAVVSTTCLKTVVGQGCNANISVTIRNQGGSTKSFDVFIYANSTLISSQTISLAPSEQRTLDFVWHVAPDFLKGNYTILLGDHLIRWVFATILGDVNGDKDVDGKDISIIAKYFGKPASAYPNADVNCDGDIDGKDISIAAKNFGKSWS